MDELRLLFEQHRYDQVQERLKKVRSYPDLSREEKIQFLLLDAEISFSRGDRRLPEIVEELTAQLTADINDETRTEILHTIGNAKRVLGHFSEATDFLQEALILARKDADPTVAIDILNALASVHGQQSQWAELHKAATEALKLAHASKYAAGYSSALITIATSERARGFHEIALEHYEHASQLLHEIENSSALGLVLNNMADLEITRGDLASGMYLLQQALFQWQTLGRAEKAAVALTQMGRISTIKGNLQEAKELLAAAIDSIAHSQAYNPLILVHALWSLADIESRSGQFEQALKLVNQATTIFEKLEISGLDLGFIWGKTARLFLDMRRTSEAQAALEKSEKICSSIEYQEGIVNCISLRGVLEMQKGNLGIAQQYLEQARKNSEEGEFFEVLIQTELSLADLYLRKLMIDYEASHRKSATDCLIRASTLVESKSLEHGKLEAKMLEAVAYSINMRFEEALEVLERVKNKAHSLELRVIEEEASKRKEGIRTQMRRIRSQLPKYPDEEMVSEVMDYISKAQAFLRNSLKQT